MNPENLSYTGTLLQRVFSYASLKVLAAAVLILLRFFFDSVNVSAMEAVFALILIDTATGLLAAYKLHEPIQSFKILRTAIKVAVYFLLISSGFLAEKTLPIKVIDETIIGALAMTELFSVLENCARAGYGIAGTILRKLRTNLTQ